MRSGCERPGAAGEAEVRKRGMVGCRCGGLEVWGSGGLEPWRPGDAEAWRAGDMETWRPETWRSGGQGCGRYRRNRRNRRYRVVRMRGVWRGRRVLGLCKCQMCRAMTHESTVLSHDPRCRDPAEAYPCVPQRILTRSGLSLTAKRHPCPLGPRTHLPTSTWWLYV